MFTILANYTTGDSFSSEVTEDKVGFCWADKDTAIRALNILAKHHKAHRMLERCFDGEKRKEILEKLSKTKWAIFEEGTGDLSVSCRVPNGSRKWQKIKAFWLGYFETLHKLTLVLDDNIAYHPHGDTKIDIFEEV